MNSIVRRVALGGVLLAVTAVGIASAASFSVSAREPHWAPVTRALEWLRVRSIRVEAAAIKVPDNLDAPERVHAGVIHVEAHCRVCHGGPGEGPGELGQGMYPQPTDLAQSAKRHSPAELFWILQNGIKMTGMPSWADHGDDQLWSVVALLGKLPTTPSAEYASLAQAVAADMAKDDAPTASPQVAPAPAVHSHAGHHHHHHGQHAR